MCLDLQIAYGKKIWTWSDTTDTTEKYKGTQSQSKKHNQ